jgi:hypothetical protein
MNLYSPKTWSALFDIFIIAGDFFMGAFFVRWLMPYMEGKGPAATKAGQIFCVASLLVCVLYIAGLWINRINFRAEKIIKISDWDNIALAFNSVLLASIFIVVITTVIPALVMMWAVIILVFGFMIGWGWLHWHILNKVSSENIGRPSLARKIAGFFMVFPFVLLVTLPANILAEQMRFGPDTEITFGASFLFPALVGLLLAMIAWFMFYIPRKFLKGFTGTNISSRSFFWALVLDYALKLTPAGFM